MVKAATIPTCKYMRHLTRDYSISWIFNEFLVLQKECSSTAITWQNQALMFRGTGGVIYCCLAQESIHGKTPGSTHTRASKIWNHWFWKWFQTKTVRKMIIVHWRQSWSSQLYAQLKQLWSTMSSYPSLHFKCIIFHKFICIVHHLWVYYKLTMYQLPVNLIAQFLEHCTSIVEVMGSNPVQAWIFFRL